MEFGQLMTDILVNVSCKFEMYIFKIAQDINENVRIAFLYVLSILCLFVTLVVSHFGFEDGTVVLIAQVSGDCLPLSLTHW